MLTESNNKTKLAIFWGIFGHFLWGFANALMKIAMDYTTAAIMLAYRFSAAFLLLTIWLLIGKGKISLKGKKLKPLILYVMVEPICFFLQTYAIQLTNSTCAGMVMAISPLAAMLLSAILLKEYPTRDQLAFCILPIIGVILLTVAGKNLGVIGPLGLLLLILYTLSSGAYKTFNRGASKEFTTFERTYFLLGGCAITYVIYALIQTRCDWTVLAEPATHPEFIVIELIMILICSIAANTMVNYSASKLSVTKVATFGAVMTLTAAFAGIVLLKEPFNGMLIIGTVLIVVGVWQVTVRGK